MTQFLGGEIVKMDSILNTIKKACNVAEDDTSFDADLIMYTNSVFMNLSQIGMTQADNFSIAGPSTTWDALLPEDDSLIAVQTYISLKVRTLFDPPASSAAMEAINKTIAELEWRINGKTDIYKEEDDG